MGHKPLKIGPKEQAEQKKWGTPFLPRHPLIANVGYSLGGFVLCVGGLDGAAMLPGVVAGC
jgi:hypothetical protein